MWGGKGVTMKAAMTTPDPFLAARPKLFGIAYRMLGSAAEAEDLVQDAWLRWQGADRSDVADPTGFLVTTTIHLAINVTQSARARRETYIGPWLPEPIDTTNDPALGAEKAEALELAVLVLLEKLSATERAAYVLREAFDYSYRQIADILKVEEPNARQLVTRARKHLADERRVPASAAEQERLLGAFMDAARRGDHAALERLFAADIVSRTDGNGVVNAARVPVTGRERVAKFVAGFPANFWKGVSLARVEANGGPAFLLSREGAPIALAMLDASTDGIESLFWVMNPEKLSRISAPRPASPA